MGFAAGDAVWPSADPSTIWEARASSPLPLGALTLGINEAKAVTAAQNNNTVVLPVPSTTPAGACRRPVPRTVRSTAVRETRYEIGYRD